MKVAVLGYGLIGRERVAALKRLRAEGEPIEKIILCDPDPKPKDDVVEDEGVVWSESLEDALALEPEWVVIATPHDVAVECAHTILPTGARILMEKPFGRSLAEAEALVGQMRKPDQIAIGFNYRFLPGVAALLQDVRSGRLGQLVSVHMVLGHGGAPGMEESWKFDPARSGGGCLIDPGIHFLDLALQLSPGGVRVRQGWSWKGFWNTGITEEAHLMLEGRGFLINLQVSIVRWRSTFLLEAHGVDGYGIVNGRGRSYGPQRYRRGFRWGWKGGRSQEDTEEEVCASECQETFYDELRTLLFGGSASAGPRSCTAVEALEVMRLYQNCVASL